MWLRPSGRDLDSPARDLAASALTVIYAMGVSPLSVTHRSYPAESDDDPLRLVFRRCLRCDSDVRVIGATTYRARRPIAACGI